MKLSRLVLVLILAFLLAPIAFPLPAPKDKDKGKEKTPPAQSVDSGSFGVFMNGRRVGTETFTVTQNNSGSVIQSDFKTEGAAEASAQHSEMLLTLNGEIRRYEWKEVGPGKAQSVVVPNEEFLTQRWSASPEDKPQEQPYLLPTSTSILDDYFFVHREILAWKFLFSVCRQGQTAETKGVAPANPTIECPLKQRAQFGTLNPHQHASAPVSMEYLGREKVTLHGSEQELNKVALKSEVGDWLLWLDNQFKLVRISIPAEKTEIVRD